MKPIPEDWPRISSSLFYEDAPAAIDWLERAFGFQTRLKVEGADNTIVHSELVYGDGVIMVNSSGRHAHHLSPRLHGGANTQTLTVYVDDVDAHCAQARAAGAVIIMEPETKNYGDDWGTNRTYGAMDTEGHRWWFTQRVFTPK
ncbi:aminotransferase [Corallococcus sp. AB049A]|uniref:Aminotransferase n=1 Tax=Corallococcus interemptor TaxID=2316720 RepID=A0A3A8Q0P6_9BACT|nr:MULTISPECIES: VOC family protein [Corallococcus]RKH39463.1 aminotransferase [Corallococcus sp. AB050B]RKH62329.1 aminotransferase [Corallococcus interemptor]RKI53787.1 aminotransferase [Corallococcus sp. AB049A]